ncbi:MAG: hypothetical protein FWG38_02835, partial [Defluviitaleaceae bacterium]|nr:hypothetical protein [Defluviitaleaceae bacterium]
MKKMIFGFLAFVVAITGMPLQALAVTSPFDAYLYDRVQWGQTVPSINGYVPEASFSGQSLGVGAFSSPSDLFVTAEGLLYIADTGNHRIVVVDIARVVYEVVDIIDG